MTIIAAIIGALFGLLLGTGLVIQERAELESEMDAIRRLVPKRGARGRFVKREQ